MDVIIYDERAVSALLPDHPDAVAEARQIVSDPHHAAGCTHNERALAWTIMLARRRQHPHPRGTAA